MLRELLVSVVITPVVNLINPDNVNSWILMAFESAPEDDVGVEAAKSSSNSDTRSPKEEAKAQGQSTNFFFQGAA